jgi:beta-alanine--pyruvate transaminase
MSLKGLPGVLDIRTVGLTAAIDLASRPDAFGKRAYDAMERAFHEENMMIRSLGETLVLTPPLVISEAQISEFFEKLGRLIRAGA